MAVSPAATQAAPELSRRYDEAFANGLAPAVRQFRVISIMAEDEPGMYDFYPADDSGKAIRSVEPIRIKKTICD